MARRRIPINLLPLFWRLGRRHPAVLLLAAFLGSGWYGYEVYYARPLMAYMGVPEAEGWGPGTWARVFRNDGFMVGYSDLRGNPLWVIYRLAPISGDTRYHQRPERFSADWRSLTRVGHDDYTGSGYDRGHLAPNYAMSRLYGKDAQFDSFLMTNITPQKPNLNQKLWQRLEEAEADLFAPRFGAVWVVTGPIFGPKTKRLRSSAWVEIPEAFFKLYIVPASAGREPQMLAFVIPQNVRGNEPLERFVTSIDRVEALTGFDFFYDLDDSVENRLEAQADPAQWPLEAASRLPGRY